MGPRSENRGYGVHLRRCVATGRELQWVHGPRTVVMVKLTGSGPSRAIDASMGPRSDNRGYVRRRGMPVIRGGDKLQWVHGPRTVVMARSGLDVYGHDLVLQWVHGPRTVVMSMPALSAMSAEQASMGPRSENRGYAFGRLELCGQHVLASMGPRSENRGYGTIGA